MGWKVIERCKCGYGQPSYIFKRILNSLWNIMVGGYAVLGLITRKKKKKEKNNGEYQQVTS